MAKKVSIGMSTLEPNNKKTCIGRGNVKTSSMNKTRRKAFKKYRGQGR